MEHIDQFPHLPHGTNIKIAKRLKVDANIVSKVRRGKHQSQDVTRELINEQEKFNKLMERKRVANEKGKTAMEIANFGG